MVLTSVEFCCATFVVLSVLFAQQKSSQDWRCDFFFFFFFFFSLPHWSAAPLSQCLFSFKEAGLLGVSDGETGASETAFGKVPPTLFQTSPLVGWLASLVHLEANITRKDYSPHCNPKARRPFTPLIVAS